MVHPFREDTPFGTLHVWDRASADYQQRHAIQTQSAHYGPWAPPESELNLLGDVRGLQILELGCGGGQCSIAFARQGAHVVGLDISEAQLNFARALALQEQVAVTFVQGHAEDLSAFVRDAWDVVFCVYTFQYIEDAAGALADCARVLRAGGRLVMSLDHPIRASFYDEVEAETVAYPARSYFDGAPMHWHFGEDAIPMVTWQHTVSEWVEMIHEAGFTLVRLLEPEADADLLDDTWPDDDALAPLRNLPQTIIFVAEKNS